MKGLIIGAVFLAGLVTAPPAAASLTREQLTQQCQPQLQTFIQEVLNEPLSEDTTPEDSAEADRQMAEREQAAREKASLRANGLNDPFVHQLVDGMRTEMPRASKAAIRKQLNDLKAGMHGITNGRGRGSETAMGFVALCLGEAVFADMEGRTSSKSQSASAAAVAAQNKAAIPPLRPTAVLEAHNPANEASQCLTLITKADFKRQRVSTTMGAVFRNSCAYPVEALWCIGARCSTGYDNVATMPAKGDRGISYETPAGVKTDTRWAGCRLGFAHRSDFAGTLHYACK